MSDFLLLGSALGGVLGVLHGASIYRKIADRDSTGMAPSGPISGLYYALWTLVLWTLFGAYVLAFWILGVLGYPIVRLIRGSRATGRTPAQLESAK